MRSMTNTNVETFLIETSMDSVTYQSIIKNDLDTHYKYEISRQYKTDSYNELQKELSSYASLDKNWDGYEAIKPPKENIEDVKIFISILKFLEIATPNIMLSCEGDISLYWELNNKYMELNFNGTNSYSYLIEEDSKFFGKDDITIKKNFPKEIESFMNKYISKKSINHKNIIYSINNTSDNFLID